MIKTRILLVDDHHVVVDALRLMLDQEDDFEVVGIAEDGRAALEMADDLSPDIVVMEVSMPELNGITATSQLIHRNPRTKVIALSSHSDRRHVLSMLEAGAHGYVPKTADSTELIEAIRKVRKGEKFLSPSVTSSVVDSYVDRNFDSSSAAAELGDREIEVLQLIAEGLTSGEIAARLHISTNTVDTHRRNLMKKLDLHNIADLTKYAIREGLTGLES